MYFFEKLPIWDGILIEENEDWQSGSSGQVPALQASDPAFKPQYHKKKKKCPIEENGSYSQF
jgi:hypothetical protein